MKGATATHSPTTTKSNVRAGPFGRRPASHPTRHVSTRSAAKHRPGGGNDNLISTRVVPIDGHETASLALLIRGRSSLTSHGGGLDAAGAQFDLALAFAGERRIVRNKDQGRAAIALQGE